MQSFEQVLSKTTFEVFNNIFGAELSLSILQNVQEFSVNGIVDFFTKRLPQIIEPSGSMIIEDLVLETLYINSGY